jgi:hypothetical protein
MSADDTATPAGHLDKGETIYYVHDEVGRPLSIHRTTPGAEAALTSVAGAMGIMETSLYL